MMSKIVGQIVGNGKIPLKKCELCGVDKEGPHHDFSEKHNRNKLLLQYSANKKLFGENRDGVYVSSGVLCTSTTIKDCTDPRIEVSVKPNEKVIFYFNVKNQSPRENLDVVFIEMGHSKLYFQINDHGIRMGCNPVSIGPKKGLNKSIQVNFCTANIGQYEMPLVFSLRKPDSNESVLIVREMVIYVEEKSAAHAEKASPYALKEVRADKMFRNKAVTNENSGQYHIPKAYKIIYARNLQPSKNATDAENKLCQEIVEVFNTGVSRENYIRFFHNLLWYEETIARINIKKYNMSTVPLILVSDARYQLYVPGLGEKRPSLVLGDLVFVKPHCDESVMFEAAIKDICSEDTILIHGLDPEFKKYYSPTGRFDVRFMASRLTYERKHQAINDVVENGPEQSRVFPKPNKNIVAIKPIKNYYNLSVEDNPEQRLAVERIVAGSAGTAPFLVHGPPGTGKTITIVEAILQLVTKNPNNRILVCTESNMAADHVAVEITKYLHMFDKKLMIRANSRFRTWETMPQCLVKYSNGSSRENSYQVSLRDFVGYKIVITTLSHAAKFGREVRVKRHAKPITHLFIDEAAQASEPSCLIPICGLLQPDGAVVLAGDPLQLGPVIISHNARRLGLGLSLMERLKRDCELYSDERNDANYLVMLRNNFRSDPDVLLIPNELFYKGQLRAKAQPDVISGVDILGERSLSRAIAFHGVLSQEQRVGKSPSFFNEMECELVQTYIKALIDKHKVLPEDIGVVTPYMRQMSKIKCWIDSQSFGGKIEVGTVEAFQGNEKRVIIISTVRANANLLDHDAKFQLGFLVDDKRFNVALTRAKAKVIVIGNPLCLQKDAKWRRYIDQCRAFGTYFGYDADQDQMQREIVDAMTPYLNSLSLKAK